MLSKKCTLYAVYLLPSSNVHHIPDEVRLMRWAPSLGAAGLAPRPRPEDNGFALVVGGGAAMAAQGSSSSDCTVFFKFNGLEVVAGGGAAMEPHKSSSSVFTAAFAVLIFGLELVAIKSEE